ncbi:DUF6702 family protein [Tunicatimonas pelagia]|uniref:DUF6702 family protein n=1 Tax=Tunicatimonas pelagia TaxID=931531 RepID=UPI002664E443|nr:DUF6702 family protein [Tunicatimonas pelagia]WKN43615.1 hypothetical protein P0M28_01360 [Tunicatimonas pelagia]
MLLTNLLFSLLFFHPFHISVTSIYHATEENSLQITVKIFADDLEEALNRDNSEATAYIDVLNPPNPAQLDSIVHNYLDQHLVFTINEQLVQPQFLGFEREDLTMWCYLEVASVKSLEKVEVRNTLLLNTFEDQANIVHVRANGVVKSMKLAHNQIADTIIF